VEAFGGSGAVLFAKEPSRVEIYNDLDHGVTNFYRVLRDEAQRARLAELLALTPYGREEYVECRDSWSTEADPVEMARRWYVTVQQGFSHKMTQRSGWSLSVVGHDPMCEWDGHMRLLPMAAARLRSVAIECADYRDLFKRLDAPDTCWYLDPPYAPGSRADPCHAYAHEFTDGDYAELVGHARALRGAVVLSCYGSPLDAQLAADGWQRVDRAHTAPTAAKKGVVGNSNRTESVWLSRPILRLDFEVPA
jgi:DNA adenine methylase